MHCYDDGILHAGRPHKTRNPDLINYESYPVYDESITTRKLANDAVTTDKIANDAVTADKLVNDAVTADKLTNDAVTTDKIIDDAVTTDKLANNAVTTDKLADNAVTPDKLVDAVRKGYVRSFETVADMQAATDLKAGMTCHTNGFHASGDGSAAYYTVSASGTANGMDVLALQSGLFATLVMSDTINVKQLGAIGNGATSEAIDQSAFERAAELIFTYTSESDNQNGVCRLYIPNGRYFISEIVLPAGSYVYGDGWQSMVFSRGTFAIEIGGNVTAPRSTVSMINFRGGYNVDLADSKGSLYILNRTQVLVDNCWFGANLGICIDGSYEVTVDNCTFDLSTQCISAINGGGSIFITNTEFWGTTSATIASFSECKKIVFDSCNISSGNGSLQFTSCDSITVSGCMRMDTLNGVNRNPNIYDLKFTGCSNIVIADCMTQRSGGGFAYFETCNYVKMCDCIVRYMDGATNNTLGIRLDECDYVQVRDVLLQNSIGLAAFYVFGTNTAEHVTFENCHFIGDAPTFGGSSGGSIFCFNTYATNKKMVHCIAEPTNTPDSAVAVVRFSTLNMYDCEFSGTYTTGTTRTYNNATINNRITPV